MFPRHVHKTLGGCDIIFFNLDSLAVVISVETDPDISLPTYLLITFGRFAAVVANETGRVSRVDCMRPKCPPWYFTDFLLSVQ